jgi:protein SCO1/2
LRFKSALDILSGDTLNQSAYHFLSITFDPEHDTPEILTQYATSYKSNDHKNWTFLTPGAAESDEFARKVGVVVTRDEKNDLNWDHNLRTLIIDRSGKIKTILVGNLWSAEELVNEVKSLF